MSHNANTSREYTAADLARIARAMTDADRLAAIRAIVDRERAAEGEDADDIEIYAYRKIRDIVLAVEQPAPEPVAACSVCLGNCKEPGTGIQCRHCHGIGDEPDFAAISADRRRRGMFGAR